MAEYIHNLLRSTSASVVGDKGGRQRNMLLCTTSVTLQAAVERTSAKRENKARTAALKTYLFNL